MVLDAGSELINRRDSSLNYFCDRCYYLTNIKSTIKNKTWASRHIEIINTEAANTTTFDISISRRYSIFSIYPSITTTRMPSDDRTRDARV